CGVKGIAMQDAAIQESMGPIQDRTREHLTSTDRAIILARRRLVQAARAVAEGKAPDGVQPAARLLRSAWVILREGVAFYDGAADSLTVKDGVEHASV